MSSTRGVGRRHGRDRGHETFAPASSLVVATALLLVFGGARARRLRQQEHDGAWGSQARVGDTACGLNVRSHRRVVKGQRMSVNRLPRAPPILQTRAAQRRGPLVRRRNRSRRRRTRRAVGGGAGRRESTGSSLRRPPEPEDRLTNPLPGIVLFLFLLGVAALSIFLLRPPAPLPESAAADQFSAERAFPRPGAGHATPPRRHCGARRGAGVTDRPAQTTGAGARGTEGGGGPRPDGGDRGERARPPARLQGRGESHPAGCALRFCADRTRGDRQRRGRRRAAGDRPRPEGRRPAAGEQRDLLLPTAKKST